MDGSGRSPAAARINEWQDPQRVAALRRSFEHAEQQHRQPTTQQSRDHERERSAAASREQTRAVAEARNRPQVRPDGRPQYSKPSVLEPRLPQPIPPVCDNQVDANNFYWHLLNTYAQTRCFDFMDVKQNFTLHILGHESPIFLQFFDTQAEQEEHTIFSTEWLGNRQSPDDVKLARKIMYVVCAKKVIFDPDKHALGLLALSSYMQIDVKYFAFNWEAPSSTAPRSVHPNSTSNLYCLDCIQYTHMAQPTSNYIWFQYEDGGNVHQRITCKYSTQGSSDIEFNWLFKSRWTVRWDNRPEANFTPWRAARTQPGSNPSTTATLFLKSMAKTHALHLWHDLNDDNGSVYKNVYQAFKRLLGMMLHDCQDFLVKGPRFSKLSSWMQQFALADGVQKQHWRNVLDESIASWHAVVLRFFEICTAYEDTNALEHREICQGLYTILVRNRQRQKVHYIDNFIVEVSKKTTEHDTQTPRPQIVTRAWPTYSKSMFVKNTQNFVLQFQKLLMQQHNQGQNMSASVFGFWFQLNDLKDWIRDIHEILRDPQLRRADPRRFRWPKCCRKGEKLETDISRSYAYKDFCRQMKLNWHDKKSQQMFLIRMRAAWLRLVACYPYTSDTSLATRGDIARYLEDQNIREVNVRNPQTAVVDSHLLHIHEADETQFTNRRVLVPGAHMTNPYLCTPR